MEDRPIYSGRLTVDDIHRIREDNYERTKGMTPEERHAYYVKEGEELRRGIAELRAAKKK